MLTTKSIEYYDSDTLLEGYYALPNNLQSKTPAVLVVHDWSGLNDFARQKAEALAQLGYIGFAVDMFGKGIIGNTKEEKSALIQPFVQDRNKLYQRLSAGLTALKTLTQVNQQKIAAIGFCFGGLCALDLARHNSVQGVISFHGLLNPPNANSKKITTKVLALHGHNDKMVPPDQVLHFQQEMTQAEADWQMHIYGNTMHAFMNPAANDAAFGTVYNKTSAERAWIAMKDFFVELFDNGG